MKGVQKGLLSIVFALFFFFHPFEKLVAQQILHSSFMVNIEMLEQYKTGYDLTLIFTERWGIRYTHIPDVKFKKEEGITHENQEVSSFQVDGDFKTYMLLQTLDFKNFDPTDKGPLDFITAYWGAGYNQMHTKIRKKAYTINNGNFVATKNEEDYELPVQSLVFGFYGQERYAVIDARLLYIKGVIKDSELLNRKIDFNQFLIQFGLGIGF